MVKWTREAQQVTFGRINAMAQYATARRTYHPDLPAQLMDQFHLEARKAGWKTVTEERARLLISRIGSGYPLVPQCPSPFPKLSAVGGHVDLTPRNGMPPIGSVLHGFLFCVAAVAIVVATSFILAIASVVALFVAFGLMIAGAGLEKQWEEETAMIMRYIANVERQFQASGSIDHNGDGIGDFANMQQFEDFVNSDIRWRNGGYRFSIVVTPGSATEQPRYYCEAVSSSNSTWFSVDQTGRVFRHEKHEETPLLSTETNRSRSS